MHAWAKTPMCIYGATNKDDNILNSTSSGGVVFQIALDIVNRGGAVCASVYDYEKHQLRHKVIFTSNELEQIKGSKYFQSDISEAFINVERFLRERTVSELLFVGTPCQCAAMMSYLNQRKIDSDRLVFIDIVCHGVGSNQIWEDCVSFLEKKHRDPIIKISFKDKRRGWLLPYAVAVGKSGTEYDLADYMTLYNKHLIMRDECHECVFATAERVGDITVGDFWNVVKIAPDFFNPKGVSNVILNTRKGEKIFMRVVDHFAILPLSLDECLQPNMKQPTAKNQLTEMFWADYSSRGYQYVIKKYASKTYIDRMRRYILTRIGKWKV